VQNKPSVSSLRFPLKHARCDQVTVIPELNKIIVFSKGKAHGSIGLIPKGGQMLPIATEGLKLQ
jgi:hypothetical protein